MGMTREEMREKSSSTENWKMRRERMRKNYREDREHEREDTGLERRKNRRK